MELIDLVHWEHQTPLIRKKLVLMLCYIIGLIILAGCMSVRTTVMVRGTLCLLHHHLDTSLLLLKFKCHSLKVVPQIPLMWAKVPTIT